MQVIISPKSKNASVWIEIYAAKQRTAINIWKFVKIVRDLTYFWGNFTLNLPNAVSWYSKALIFFSSQHKTHLCSSLVYKLQYDFSSTEWIP